MRNPEYRRSTRRSDTNSQTRRQPLPFPDDAPFKILSIDGGGVRGIFPATILTYLEGQHLNGKPIGNYFDLIAGTSTGGIIALGLGAGLSAQDLLNLYMDKGSEIFPVHYPLKGFVRSAYPWEPLYALLRETLGTKKLQDSLYRLLVPSTEGKNGDPYIFKTPHHRDYHLDVDMLMSDVARATTAAPTYFESMETKNGYTLLDGGIWANNPIMLALTEALSCFNVRRTQIMILSLGCGQKPFHISSSQVRGGQYHWRKIFEVEMYFQSFNALNQARLLIGPERVTRLDRLDSADTIDLDDWKKAKQLLPDEAFNIANEKGADIANNFLKTPARCWLDDDDKKEIQE